MSRSSLVVALAAWVALAPDPAHAGKIRREAGLVVGKGGISFVETASQGKGGRLGRRLRTRLVLGGARGVVTQVGTRAVRSVTATAAEGAGRSLARTVISRGRLLRNPALVASDDLGHQVESRRLRLDRPFAHIRESVLDDGVRMLLQRFDRTGLAYGPERSARSTPLRRRLRGLTLERAVVASGGKADAIVETVSLERDPAAPGAVVATRTERAGEHTLALGDGDESHQRTTELHGDAGLRSTSTTMSHGEVTEADVVTIRGRVATHIVHRLVDVELGSTPGPVWETATTTIDARGRRSDVTRSLERPARPE